MPAWHDGLHTQAPHQVVHLWLQGDCAHLYHKLAGKGTWHLPRPHFTSTNKVHNIAANRNTTHNAHTPSQSSQAGSAAAASVHDGLAMVMLTTLWLSSDCCRSASAPECVCPWAALSTAQRPLAYAAKHHTLQLVNLHCVSHLCLSFRMSSTSFTNRSRSSWFLYSGMTQHSLSDAHLQRPQAVVQQSSSSCGLHALLWYCTQDLWCQWVVCGCKVQGIARRVGSRVQGRKQGAVLT